MRCRSAIIHLVGLGSNSLVWCKCYLLDNSETPMEAEYCDFSLKVKLNNMVLLRYKTVTQFNFKQELIAIWFSERSFIIHTSLGISLYKFFENNFKQNFGTWTGFSFIASKEVLIYIIWKILTQYEISGF